MFGKGTISVRSISPRRLLMLCAVLTTAFFGACGQLDRPTVEPFYAVSPPPPKQELKWSNGKTPKSLDPARAVAAPETDIVRAVYEGLTDLDSKTLAAVPGVAEKWSSTDGDRTWTFHLRKDARWSNGERVTAEDFVRSWKRLRDLGDKTGSVYLYQNIIGMRPAATSPEQQTGDPVDFLHLPDATAAQRSEGTRPETDLTQPPNVLLSKPQAEKKAVEPADRKPLAAVKFGVESVDDATLRIHLDLPDQDFPKLVANPVFRPVYGDGSGLDTLTAKPITNGAFRITEISDGGLTLDKSDRYWNASAVTLERVKFVSTKTAEAALDAYRKGDVDIITNAAFEPLALKLLSPYEDFRRTAHSALNYYEFNTDNAPFNDRRVREALALAIDRDKLTEGELEGSTEPATVFLPLGDLQVDRLVLDVDRAHTLMTQAGFPNGETFPQIRLVVNRNDIQQRVARTVARMWKQNLNLDTQITVKEAIETEQARAAGEYDLIRRGVVLPSADELVSLITIFGIPPKIVDTAGTEPVHGEFPADAADAKHDGKNGQKDAVADENKAGDQIADEDADSDRLAEEDAMYEMNAIPLYFPMSYSLVKPYVKGFEMNGLDAPSLRQISIDGSWQPKTARN
ncbi:MAG: peptide ABC transporter substrate-binding protein [Pyrinomonadaceae bacterium]